MHDPVRFLIVSFDGLRTDMVTPELTPNLCSFRARSTSFANHRATFPSDTRANIATLVTGAHTGRHGVLGNAYLERLIEPTGIIDTVDAQLMEAMDQAYGGRLFCVDTLGENLGRSGRKQAVISSASPGASWLLNHKVKTYPEHFLLACHCQETSWPGEAVREITERFGPLMPPTEPDLDALTYGTDIFLDYVWPRMKPDLSILWLNEPDASYHRFGIGSAEARKVIAEADAQFGRILSWWDKEGFDANVQIIMMSDHGHVGTLKKIDVVAELAAAGFNASETYPNDAEITVLPGACGQIYVRDSNPKLIAAVAEFVMTRPWCGLTFSAGKNEIEGLIEGTFARSLVFADHARSADFLYSYRTHDTDDPQGFDGCRYYSSPDTNYASMHGGLHPREIAALNIIGGSLFHEDTISTCHSGIVDIAPTILTALGEPIPSEMQGRVLVEAFLQHGARGAESVTEILEAGVGNYSQILHRVRVGDSVYVDFGANS